MTFKQLKTVLRAPSFRPYAYAYAFIFFKEILLLRRATKRKSWMCSPLTVPVGFSRHTSQLSLRATLCKILLPTVVFRFLFCEQNAFKVRAVSRSNDRRKPPVLHHRWNWSKPPGRHWDCQENDQDGKGNKMDTYGFVFNVNRVSFCLFLTVRTHRDERRTQLNMPINNTNGTFLALT